MNRAERRQAAKHKQKTHSIGIASPEVSSLMRKEFQRGRASVYDELEQGGGLHVEVLRKVMACVGIALHNVHGFGGKRIEPVMTELRRLMNEETSPEMCIDRLEKETGIKLIITNEDGVSFAEEYAMRDLPEIEDI